MQMRKLTSLTLLPSFVILLLTSIVLYIVPEGRVAYWSDWHLFWLSKSQWGDIHTNSGFLFLAAGLLHLWHNWRPMTAYLKIKIKTLSLLTPAFSVALAVNLIVLVGTLLLVPPFSTILDIGHGFKERAAVRYGEPPYGHAELSSLALFTKRTGLDLEAAKRAMGDKGLRVSGDDQTILAIAQANGLTPRAIYEAMRQGATQETKAIKPVFPDKPFPGMGRLRLADLCGQYGLDQEHIMQVLAAKGIQANPEKSLKEIAEAHRTTPHALFALIHEAATIR